MSTEPTHDTPSNKPGRLAAARQRMEFWRIWTDEAQTAEGKRYFASRLNYWRYRFKAIQMEAES